MEDITLEKIDMIRQRTGIGYAAAKEILEKNNGNVVDSLIYIEQNQKTFAQNVTETSNELIDTVKDIVKKGNVNRIKIKKDNKVLIDIPITAGIVTGALTLFYPSLLVIGAVTAILSKVSIEVERPNGEVEVINDIVKEKYDDVKQRAEDLVNNVKDDIKQKKDEFTGNNEDNNPKDNTNE
jgi:gas vesicle protein